MSCVEISGSEYSSDNGDTSSSDHTQCLCPRTTSTDNTSLDIIQHVVDLLDEDGWNFSSVQGSAIVFDDKLKHKMKQPTILSLDGGGKESSHHMS